MDKPNKFKLKRDSYMSARGGSSAFYNIYCAHCRRWLLLYQKDGPGNLFRLYFDRIHSSEEFISDKGQIKIHERSQGLRCPHCDASIGIQMIYKPENRPAFRLIPSSIIKKRSDGVLPAPPTANTKEDSNDPED